jgi:hypothetical protein
VSLIETWKQAMQPNEGDVLWMDDLEPVMNFRRLFLVFSQSGWSTGPCLVVSLFSHHFPLKPKRTPIITFDC